MKFICITCKNMFENRSHGRPKYCSDQCKMNGNWGKVIGRWNKGRKHSEEWKKIMSSKSKELKNWKVLFKPEVRQKAIENARKVLINKPSWNKGKKALWTTGEKNFNWKGGITSNDRLERIKFHKQIQKKVFERDDYTCQLCGSKGVDLQVDHIQSWAEYVELRFNIENCRTLCVKCHYKITFGKPMPPTVRAWGHNIMRGEIQK